MERQERDSSLGSSGGSEEGSINSIPLPPRVAPRSSTSSQLRASSSSSNTPRQRKYPLDLSHYNGGGGGGGGHSSSHSDDTDSSNSRLRHQSRGVTSRALPPDPDSAHEEDDLNSTRESEESVFSESSSHNSLSFDRSRDTQQHHNNHHSAPPPPTATRPILLPPAPPRPVTNSQFSVKSVKFSARDLGYQDTSDLFWSKDVSLQELGSTSDSSGEQTEIMSNGHVLIAGRYKTSDTVSYEDLLEFALDGVSERDPELDVCDEVRLMRRVLTKDVTIEDCMYALEETEWNVNSAIKLIKLKQLLSTNLADKEHCKHVLLLCNWQVTEAADFLLRQPSGQDSPEVVNV